MNPYKKEDFTKLVQAVRESRRKLRGFREKRKELVALFCGSEYGGDGAEAKNVYLNLISLAVSIYVRQCVVRAPTAKVTTPYRGLRPLAAELALACKDAAAEVKLGEILRKAVTEALFSPLATVKIGLHIIDQKDVAGDVVDVTEPFVSMVSFDDYVRDMSARSADSPAFEGDMYYLDKDVLLKRYPKMKGMGVSAADLGMQDESGGDRAESISHGMGSGDDNLGDKVAVQDVWLTKEKLLVTYLVNKPDRPLSVIEFDGDEDGPYRSLWFNSVPDNAMPLPPFSLLRNIHELANNLFRRLAAQAKRQKRVAGFSDEESANRFARAHDGDAIFWDGAKPESIEIGGVDQRTFALMIQVKDIFSWAAGNLDSLGGLSPMSDTASQDEMLARASSAQMADMQDGVAEFARRIFRQIAWYEWTDPIRNRILQKELKGTGIIIPVKWTPETRQGDFLDFNFSINPQSMREESPAGKIKKLGDILDKFLLPLQPMFEQQGLMVDGRRLTALIADYADLPELEQLVVAVSGQQQPTSGPIGNPTPMPANTTRTNIRVNRPGATRVGKDMALIQQLMGGRVQKAESAAIGRGNT